jgi:hypothetical protein
VTADRVAEALAALETAEKGATPGPWRFGDGYEWEPDDLVAPTVIEEWPREKFDDPTEDLHHVKRVGTTTDWDGADADFVEVWRNAAPALLALVKAAVALLEDDESRPGGWGPDITMQEPVRAALAELAEAVLSPPPSPGTWSWLAWLLGP